MSNGLYGNFFLLQNNYRIKIQTRKHLFLKIPSDPIVKMRAREQQKIDFSDSVFAEIIKQNEAKKVETSGILNLSSHDHY